MKDFKESLIIMLMTYLALVPVACAVAITAIANQLPMMIIAGAIGASIVIATFTGCAVVYRGLARPKDYFYLDGGYDPDVRIIEGKKKLLLPGRRK